MVEYPVFFMDGSKIGNFTFNGTPLMGDVFLATVTDGDLTYENVLVMVISRRWNKEGSLELVVGYY